MATNTNTIKTRIQLKSDTEANWRKSVLTSDHPQGEKTSGTSFVPLLGELIVFTADSTHPFSRLKIGDGISNVLSLHFIDAGTIDGRTLAEASVSTYANRQGFPLAGEDNRLYVDLSTNIIYCYTDLYGYTQLSNFTYIPEKVGVSNITYWRTGTNLTLSCSDGILNITRGTLPQLNYETVQVIKNLTKEEAE